MKKTSHGMADRMLDKMPEKMARSSFKKHAEQMSDVNLNAIYYIKCKQYASEGTLTHVK